MQPAESKPAEATENSAATTTAHPLARELYDWSSRLTAEAGGSEEYYWTPEIEWLVTKLKLTKRALVGVVGVQGAGKSATMRAIRDQLKNEFPDSTVAVKVPESGGLVNALRSVFDYGGGPYREEFLLLIKEKIVNELKRKQVFMDRARRLARRTGNSEMSLEISQLSAVRTHQEAETVPSWLQDLVPHRVVRELEATALHLLIQQQRVILIDMPDYPKHDRRLIARDLDDIQGLWNRLMIHPDVTSDANIVVFIQKETFNYADHFLYGKMTIVDLIPLTTGQLLEAYKQRWGGYAPFTEDALQYIARMSHGIFRRFKRYITLTLEMSSQPLLDLELIKKAVDEEIMRDIDKELESVFRKREQKEKALEVMKVLSDEKIRREEARTGGVKSTTESYGEARPDGLTQSDLAEMVDLSEMALSRLVRELEQHGYVKRTAWRQWTYVDMNW
jgi:ABC-type dipeptide/oligopeptide/nickel transport system ATPase component